jgi:hypothetical protein
VRIDDEVNVAVYKDEDGGGGGAVRCLVKHVIRVVTLSTDTNIRVHIKRILFNKTRCQ